MTRLESFRINFDSTDEQFFFRKTHSGASEIGMNVSAHVRPCKPLWITRIAGSFTSESFDMVPSPEPPAVQAVDEMSELVEVSHVCVSLPLHEWCGARHRPEGPSG